MTEREKRADVFACLRVSACMIRRIEEANEKQKNRYIERILKKETSRFAELEKQAEKYLDDLNLIEREFVNAYFFCGMTVKETSVVIDRSVRHCERLRSKFIKKDGVARKLRSEEESTNE